MGAPLARLTPLSTSAPARSNEAGPGMCMCSWTDDRLFTRFSGEMLLGDFGNSSDSSSNKEGDEERSLREKDAGIAIDCEAGG